MYLMVNSIPIFQLLIIGKVHFHSSMYLKSTLIGSTV